MALTGGIGVLGNSGKKSRNSGLIFLVLLALLVFGVFYNTLDNAPTNWDDPAIFRNSMLHGISIPHLKSVLSYHVGSAYQPIRDLSYMLDFSLWGKKVILGLHLDNILLYYLMLVACWFFLKELFMAFSLKRDSALRWATFSTTIYALHPVHVESVAWLFARKEPLLGIFTFLSLYFFLKARKGGARYLVISLVCFILALLSQPTSLVIPAVAMVMDILLLKKQENLYALRRRLVIYLVLFAIALPLTGLLLYSMARIGGIKPYHGGSFWTNLLAVSQILATYIKLIGFTINYAADYPIRLYTDMHAWWTWFFICVHVTIIGSVIWAYVMGRYIYVFFVLWFYIFLFPVSHIFPISQTLADRYALLPSLAWCVMLGHLINSLWEFRPQYSKFSQDFPALVGVSLFISISLAYGGMTVRQNDIWQNSVTLWEDTLAKYPNSSPANVNLSVIYISHGKYKEAQELCVRAIKELPYDYLAINNLALAQMMMGQYDNAIHNYREALKLKPTLLKAKLGLANALWHKRDYKEVYNLYQDCLKSYHLGRTSYVAFIYYRQGFCAYKLGMRDRAIEYLKDAYALRKRNPSVLGDVAAAYTSMGLYKDARDAYAALLAISRDSKKAHEIEEKIREIDHAIKKSGR